jgi:surfeit locus 1 family protein
VTSSSGAPRRVTVAGIIASLALLAVVLACVRLGFWQLARRAERLALNERVAARMRQPPLADAAVAADTARSLYRLAVLEGEYDVARSIVLPGRSFNGVPGVHLLTPLRRGGRAVLVNRGWVPAADGATIATDSFPVTERAARGLVLPFPGHAESLAPARDAVADSGFRKVWFTIDAAALRAQFPYELLPFTLQLLPAPDAPRYPHRLDPPPLDQGPHLSYAIQWFSFALIGIIGWLALLRRGRGPNRVAPPLPLLLALVALGLGPRPATAQLRPLDPFEWRVLEDDIDVLGSFGSAATFDQRVPLAGSRGHLLELGSYRLLWRSGRIGLDLSGTAFWRYAERDSLEAPATGVEIAEHGVRQDFGPATASAFVRISPATARTDLVVRFGARLPTTSHASGLERDETDFFALVGGMWESAAWALAAELGVGIHGSVSADYRQSDVLLYNLGVRRTAGPLTLTAFLVGHVDGHHWRIRGNEDQGELRLALRTGQRRWLQLGYLHGITAYSPGHGASLGVGFATGCAGDCLP